MGLGLIGCRQVPHLVLATAKKTISTSTITTCVPLDITSWAMVAASEMESGGQVTGPLNGVLTTNLETNQGVSPSRAQTEGNSSSSGKSYGQCRVDVIKAGSL